MAISRHSTGQRRKHLIGGLRDSSANRHNKILQEKLRAFAIGDPELQDALMDYDRLNKKYAEEREKKFN